MAKIKHRHAVDHLLNSIYSNGDTLLSSFMFGKPGAPSYEKNMGTDLYVEKESFTKALLFIRNNGAPYLKVISISVLWSMATQFITDNFWYIGRSTFLSKMDGPYSLHVSSEDKESLAEAIAESPLFHPRNDVTLYPLSTIRVLDSFECDRFFLLPANELSCSHLTSAPDDIELNPNEFPPFPQWSGATHRPLTWLGIKSPLDLISDKMKCATLGAIALTPLPAYRYLFCGREVPGGKCTVNDRYTVSGFDNPHTPPLMNDVLVTQADHVWLSKLTALLTSDEKRSSSQIRALEYFYRAWFLNSRERFPTLSMSLDSLVEANNGHTREAIKLVRKVVGSEVNESRLRLLMRIRGAVIHGAAPDVYESENYAQYYLEYGVDPIYDLELIVAKCLREEIFNGDLKYHSTHNQEMGDNLKKESNLPQTNTLRTIIASNL